MSETMTTGTVSVVFNGQTISLTYDSSTQKWVGTTTAGSKSSYGRDVAPDGTETETAGQQYYRASITATDTYGNTSGTITGSSSGTAIQQALCVRVKEKVVPTIENISPASGAYNTTGTQMIAFDLKDNNNGQNAGYSGIDLTSLVLTLTPDGGAAQTITTWTSTAISGGYHIEYTATSLADADYTIDIAIADYDGNTATATSTFEVDTSAPSLDVSSPTEGALLNSRTITIAGSTDAGSTVTATVGGTDVGTITVDASGNFSKSYTVSGNGSYAVVVTTEDGAGNTYSITRNISVYVAAVDVSNVVIAPNPADGGATLTITATVTLTV